MAKLTNEIKVKRGPCKGANSLFEYASHTRGLVHSIIRAFFYYTRRESLYCIWLHLTKKFSHTLTSHCLFFFPVWDKILLFFLQYINSFQFTIMSNTALVKKFDIRILINRVLSRFVWHFWMFICQVLVGLHPLSRKTQQSRHMFVLLCFEGRGASIWWRVACNGVLCS